MKTNRQSKIIEIIQKNEVETQDELSALLEKDGFRAASVSFSSPQSDALRSSPLRLFYAVHPFSYYNCFCLRQFYLPQAHFSYLT